MDPRGLIRLQALFLFSLLLVLIRKVDSNDHLWNWGRKTNAAVLLCLIIPIWGATQVLNMPLLTMYRFGIYGMAFLLGYFVFSHDNVQQIVQNMHIPMLLIAIFLGILYAVTYYGQNYAASTCLQSLLTNAYLWTATLAILGCAQTWLHYHTNFTSYMANASFGMYFVHYPIVLVICYTLDRLNVPSLLAYALALAAELLLTPLFYEGLKRIPVIRLLVLGIK